jgi:PEP-CTERM motif
MKNFGIAAMTAIGLAIASPASAAQYGFTFVTSTALFGAPVTGSGVFTTTDTAAQVNNQTAFAITSISGMVNGSAIVAPTGNYGNYFTTGPSFLDGTGLRFFTAAGNDIRFFFQDTAAQYRVNTFSPGSSSFVTATSTAIGAVPEASTWAMMLAGFGIVGSAVRLRRRRLVHAYA